MFLCSLDLWEGPDLPQCPLLLLGANAEIPFFGGCPCGPWKFLSRGLSLHFSSDPCHSCARPGIEPAPTVPGQGLNQRLHSDAGHSTHWTTAGKPHAAASWWLRLIVFRNMLVKWTPPNYESDFLHIENPQEFSKTNKQKLLRLISSARLQVHNKYTRTTHTHTNEFLQLQ